MRTSSLVTVVALMLMSSIALGQQKASFLKPPDRSSPRATLKTFLDSTDAVVAFVAQEYRSSPTRAGFNRMFDLAETPIQCLDLSEVAPASRLKTGSAAALALYETLSRIDLPPWDQVPGADELKSLAATDPPRWVVPNTEITLVRVMSGPHSGEFVFSAPTVARAEAFYNRVRGLPYTRPVPLKDPYQMTIVGGGWFFPLSWIEAMPPWLRTAVGGQAAWKWVALILVLILFAVLLRAAYWLSRRVSNDRPFLQALARLSLPAFLIATVPIVAYLALVQINFRGGVGSAMQLAATAMVILAGAWLSWRVAAVVAEAIIASPNIAPESIDAHLIRICTRLLGLTVAAGLLVVGADRLGLPLYGIIAGLGVGGLAIALAAQPTIENLIGGFSLFADKPIRVGDACKYGSDAGTVEQIGIRSTRIRGVDRTLTTIPNAVLSKMPIVNLTQRERMLIRTVISVRQQASPEQLRYILAKLREMLLGHPRIHHDPARARFIGFGASSLDIEVTAYAMTQDWDEFLAIQEDVFLRIIDIVEQSGSGFRGPDPEKAQAAEAQVRQWREEGRLPFPNFSPEQMRQIRRSLTYPPPGSPEAARESNPVDGSPQTAAVDERTGAGYTTRAGGDALHS